MYPTTNKKFFDKKNIVKNTNPNNKYIHQNDQFNQKKTS